MTPAELRSLADEATPGPWTKDPDSNAIWANFTRNEYMPGAFIDEGDLLVYDEGSPNEQDARLIALAPDLARLCAEMGEVLSEATGFRTREALHRRDPVLAKLSMLEAK